MLDGNCLVQGSKHGSKPELKQHRHWWMLVQQVVAIPRPFGHNLKDYSISTVGAFPVKAFTQHLTQVKGLLLIDNITAVTYINKMGGTRSPILSSLAFKLWSWCLQRQNSIMARHIPGIQNLQANQESHTVVDHSDWKLKPEFSNVFRDFGVPWK